MSNIIFWCYITDITARLYGSTEPLNSDQSYSNFNLRLIIPTPQDPHQVLFLKRLGTATKYVFLGILTLQFVIPSSYIGTSNVADASIRGAVSSILGIEATAALTEVGTNSQKMPLLEAPVNVSITSSSSLNNISENTALVASAKVLSSPTPVVVAKKETVPPKTKITSYKVQSGDTVSALAEKFDISSKTIIFANNLKHQDALTVGQTLVILPISGIKHVVASGDTINGIAAKYKGDVQEIISYNDIQGGKIKIGDTVVIPDGDLAYTPPAQKTASTAAAVVQKVATAALGVNVAKAETPTVISSGYFMRPIKAGTRTQGIHGANAVDLADSCGTSIYAAAGGVVSVALGNGGYNGGFGNYVVIDHDNGSQTLYAHMKTVSVAAGATVSKGQAIGTIGATGKVHGTTGCHVHFEVHGQKNPF